MPISLTAYNQIKRLVAAGNNQVWYEGGNGCR